MQSLSLYLRLLAILQHSCGLLRQVLELHPPANNPPPPNPKHRAVFLSLYLRLLVILQHSRGLLLQVLEELHPPANNPHPTPASQSVLQSLSLPVPSGDPPAQPWPAPTGPWWPSSLSQLPPPPQSLSLPVPSGDPPAQPWPAPTGPWWASSLSQLPPPPPRLSLYLCLLVILQHSHGLLLQVLEELYPPANNPPIPPPSPKHRAVSLSTCAFWWSSSTAVACSSRSLKSFIPQPTPPHPPPALCSLYLSLPVPSGDPPAQPWPAPPGPWRASSLSQHPPPTPPQHCAVSISLYLRLLVILQHSRGLLLQVLEELHPPANTPPTHPQHCAVSISLYLCLLVILQHSRGLLLQVLEELHQALRLGLALCNLLLQALHLLLRLLQVPEAPDREAAAGLVWLINML